MVVTNRYFTQAARKLARANRVELWDRDQLVEALLKVERRDAAGDLAG
jgi:HJR/Mrr/RecB family endonuclease